MPFTKLGLAPAIVKAVKAMGYTDPTPIQFRAIPLALSGHDLIGSAQTGTGKTAAFALPVLSQLGEHGSIRALILEPTRELAGQVETSFRDYSRFTKLKTVAVYGGAGFGGQAGQLRDADIVVATPGRLLDHLTRGTVKFNNLQFLVLDEADRMLDMGFMPDMRKIVERLPKERQTFMFSATLPPEIEALIKWCMRDPKTIEIGQRRSPAETVSHALYPVNSDMKSKLLLALMDHLNYDSMLVFTRTKHRADRVARTLKEAGHAVAVLHSNRTQRERERALVGFRDGRFDVMVATDIAARGLDVDSITHVINFDIPMHPEDYVHRIGRTGRAASTGDALSLVSSEDRKAVVLIERYIGRTIERKKLEGFDYGPERAERAPSFERGGGGGQNRGRQGGGYGNRQRGGGRSYSGGGGQREQRGPAPYNPPAQPAAASAPAPRPQAAASDSSGPIQALGYTPRAPGAPAPEGGGQRGHFRERQQAHQQTTGNDARQGGPRPPRNQGFRPKQTRDQTRPWER